MNFIFKVLIFLKHITSVSIFKKYFYQFPVIGAWPLQLPNPNERSVLPPESSNKFTLIPVLLLIPVHPSQQIPSDQHGVGKHCSMVPCIVKLPQPFSENVPEDEL